MHPLTITFLQEHQNQYHPTPWATPLFMLRCRKTYYLWTGVGPLLMGKRWEVPDRKKEMLGGWSGKLLVEVLQIKCLSLPSSSLSSSLFLFILNFLRGILISLARRSIRCDVFLSNALHAFCFPLFFLLLMCVVCVVSQWTQCSRALS